MARYLAWIVVVIAALSVSSLALPQDLDQTRPHPSFSPDAVVRIQMEALGRNDEPYADRGIEITWEFASPGNKVFTGPLERFKTMIHGRNFGPMLNHKSVEYENLRVDGGDAQLDVIVLTADDRYVGYRFGLSRQTHPSCKGCWMTDSVVPFEVTAI
ncbi:MAG: DUF4864 domain-containing protein [Proteobacteria bacterium]|nr:DUF4864 domain-containing protein [Pseudomonadota bacterium]